MLKLQAEKRTTMGKQNRKLRDEGRIPGVVYGPALKEPQAVSIDLIAFEKLWKRAGESSMVELEFDGKIQKVLIHDVEHHPVRGIPTHVDFYALDTTQPIRLHIPLVFAGESIAVKSLGGVLVKVFHDIEIEALPDALPHELTVDLALLETLTSRIHVKDIRVPSGVSVHGDSEAVVALVEAPISEAELAALEEKPASIDFEKIEDVEKRPAAEAEEDDEASASTKE